MCDDILMPDGTVIEQFDGEDRCLCGKTQEEILMYIIPRIRELEDGEALIIHRTWVGWEVTIEDKAIK